MVSDKTRKRVINKMEIYLVERLMSEKNLSRDIAGGILKKSLLYEMLLDPKTESLLRTVQSASEAVFRTVSVKRL